jgi:hypothetical protein
MNTVVDAASVLRAAHKEGFTLLLQDGFVRIASWPPKAVPADLRALILENLVGIARLLRSFAVP